MRKESKVVMVDQDGVISGRDYQATKDISPLIRSMCEQGTIIVPNSDTPVDRLKRNIEFLLGFSANTIIAEKGAVVSLDGQYKFTKNIPGINEYKLSLEKLFLAEDVLVYTGDSATWIREGKIFVPHSRLIIVDALRQQSVGFYMKCSDTHGTAYTNLDWCEQALEIIYSLELPNGLEPLDYNPKYGIAIANASGVKKSDGYRLVRDFLGQARYFMIGDQMADFIDDPDVVQCAVGNAANNYKNIASFIAASEYTEGLEECLRWIAVQ